MLDEVYIMEISKLINLTAQEWDIDVCSSFNLFFHKDQRIILDLDRLNYGAMNTLEHLERYLCFRPGAENSILNLPINNSRLTIMRRLKKLFKIDNIDHYSIVNISIIRTIVSTLFDAHRNPILVFSYYYSIKHLMPALIKITDLVQLQLKIRKYMNPYRIARTSNRTMIEDHKRQLYARKRRELMQRKMTKSS